MAMSITTVIYGAILVGGLALFGLGDPAVAATSVTGGGTTLTSLSVDLPDSDREFPPGPGVEVAQANCAACHSVGMVLNQPALSHATWETEVHKMVAVYKAPVSDEDAKTIVAYLERIKGAK